MTDQDAAAEAPREVELKFELDPQAIELLDSHPLLHDGAGASRSAQRLEATYFDTEDLALRRAGYSLRIRREDGRAVQTVKAVRRSAGLFDRGEWECEVAGERPDLAATGDFLAPLLGGPEVVAGLHPLFATRVDRRIVRIERDGAVLELAIDQGEIDAAGRAERLCELELELKSGDAAALFAAAGELVDAVPARLAAYSKSDRGYKLAAGEAARPVKAGDPGLERGMTTAAALRAIGRECLHQLIANDAVFGKADVVEVIHQMRVAMRRFRAALSLFKPLVGDPETDALKGELRWFAGVLGGARDLDVFTEETLQPQRDAGLDLPGLDSFVARLDRLREDAHERVREAIASPRYRRLLLSAAAWLELGAWRSPAAAAGSLLAERPIEEHAREELQRRWMRVGKKGRRLKRLDPETRHEVRIEIKKLRYATDFFARLYDERQGHKRAFLGALEDLQDQLGALNDIATARTLALEIAAPGEGAPIGREDVLAAFAAGAVSSARQGKEADLLDDAAEAVSRLRKAEPFWD